MLKQAIVAGVFALLGSTAAFAENTDTLTQVALLGSTQRAAPSEANDVVDPQGATLRAQGQEQIDALANTVLFDAVGDWLGTPYRSGGRTRRGTCCSGFVAALFDEVYDLNLYGSSRDQWTRVEKVAKRDLREGDLVFFAIHSRSISHVGVYMGSGRFAHASSSRGVIISELTDPYYSRYYYGGGRLKEFAFDKAD